MAHYIFVKNRHNVKQEKVLDKLEKVCHLLTSSTILERSENVVSAWLNDNNSFYAIQNSESIKKVEKQVMVIGWLRQEADIYNNCSVEADGSYAIIKNDGNEISFFTDQFGSRALWYYLDKEQIIVSTSQRAIVALKGDFQLNEKALAWYLSSGCQGPFECWDKDTYQVLPNLEYKFNISNWMLDTAQKSGMELPKSGTVKMEEYVKIYEKQVSSSLKQIINEYPKGQVLMPLSGGLDSRSILALSMQAGLSNDTMLVNWGEPTPKGVFDDKIAAKRVADFYNKIILDKYLPVEIDSYDYILDRYAKECEGRIDHLSSFTDGYQMWEDFFYQGYRMIVRGDIPVTEGLDINNIQARARNGLSLFKDYANVDEFPVKRYIKLQSDYGSERHQRESLIRWRDRLFAHWTMPMQVSAFSQQVSSFTENRAPMLTWSLFKLYMALPDKEKGNKIHMQKIWERNDKTGISRYAVRSLRSVFEILDNEKCNQYLVDKLATYEQKSIFSPELITAVRYKLIEKNHYKKSLKSKPTILPIYEWLTDNMPLLMKSYIRSKRPNKLSASVLGYRIVLAEKIITMYEIDAQQIIESK